MVWFQLRRLGNRKEIDCDLALKDNLEIIQNAIHWKVSVRKIPLEKVPMRVKILSRNHSCSSETFEKNDRCTFSRFFGEIFQLLIYGAF